MSYLPSEAAKLITVTEKTEDLVFYAYDMTEEEYVTDFSASLDGVEKRDHGRVIFLDVVVGRHTAELTKIRGSPVPDGYVFDHWASLAGDSWVKVDIDDPTSRSTGITTHSGGPGFLRAYIKKKEVETSITVSAPDRVEVDETFTVSGRLIRTDTGVGLPSQPVNVYYNTTIIGSTTTGSDGGYTVDCSIPETGGFTLKSRFPGAAMFKLAEAAKGISVGPPPTWVELAAVAVAACAPVLMVGGVVAAQEIAKLQR